MFTGIVEYVGTVVSVAGTEAGARLAVDAGPVGAGSEVGDSVAVNGVCLTVVAKAGEVLSFDAVRETLRRTDLGDRKPGDRVNLERPLRADGRLGGHIVQGHVDATGRIRVIEPEGAARRIRIEAPPPLLRYIVEKGSIAVDGISLTVAAVLPDGFEVAIIPHTWTHTALCDKTAGQSVNLEVDLLAKYVERLLTFRLPRGAGE